MLLNLKIFLELQLSSVAASRIERNPSTSLLSSAVVSHLQTVNCKVAHDCLQLKYDMMFLEAFTAFQTYFLCYICSWTCMASQSFRWKRPMLSAVRVQSASVADSTQWFPSQWHLYLEFLSSMCQHIPCKGKLKICIWNFLAITWRQKNGTLQNSQV